MRRPRTQTQVEQRITSRIPMRVQVEYENLDDFLDDYTSNVSLGGMFLECEDPLPVGSRFRLRFRVQGRLVETYGTVRWVVGRRDGLTPGMGLQFDALSRGDRRAVEGWLGPDEAYVS